jgi:hypothetical protein
MARLKETGPLPRRRGQTRRRRAAGAHSVLYRVAAFVERAAG